MPKRDNRTGTKLVPMRAKHIELGHAVQRKVGEKPKKDRYRQFLRAARVYSLAIRARDKKCVTCGAKLNLQCGHLITRVKKSVFFDPLNNHAQCSSCNFKHEYYPEIYTSWFIKRYGLAVYEDLVRRSNETKKWTVEELQEIERSPDVTIKIPPK